MKYFLITILFSVSVFATDVNDLIAFQADYPNDVNLVDYAVFAAAWSDELIDAAADIDVNTVSYTLTQIKGKITTISSLPAGQLFDISGSDYYYSERALLKGNFANLSVGFREIDSVPYKPMRNSKTVYYYSQASGSDSFTYQNHDGDTGTITITKADFPRDSVSFTGGSIAVDHNSLMDFDNSFCISAWIKPKAEYMDILSKRNTGGSGYKLSIRSGRLRFEAWDANSNYYDIRNHAALWFDDWNFIAVSGNESGTFTYVNNTESGIKSNAIPPFQSEAGLVIGEGLTGELDRLSFWSTYKDSFSMALLSMEARDGAGGGLMVPTDYLVRFNFDEGSGFTITDSVAGLTGTLSGAVNWLPNNQPTRRPKQQFNILGGR